jgi:hypothetical protein
VWILWQYSWAGRKRLGAAVVVVDAANFRGCLQATLLPGLIGVPSLLGILHKLTRQLRQSHYARQSHKSRQSRLLRHTRRSRR